uniref:L1 transposable element RRM domain-containing protein n=1 Tax=Maylandia zebra TaxID=106582 RepID=A0A3P9B0A0_9CICH
MKSDQNSRKNFFVVVLRFLSHSVFLSTGAKIVKEQSSASYLSEQGGLKLWGLTLIPAKPPCVSSRVVIQETKTEIMRCKEEIEKGRKESKAEMEKWAKSVEDNTKAQFELLREEVRLISETSVSLANKMEARKKEVDDTLNDQSDSITSMETKLKELEKEMLMLRRRSEDLEARSRRNNIRIVGVREGAETGKTPSEFIAGLLKEKLGLSVTPTLDRAHRTLGARRDGAGAPPRAFVVRCHYYIEKEEILRKAREMERTPEGRSGRIHIFPDYTQEVNNKRAAFKEARSLLRTYGGVRYGLRYPATLVITPEGGQTKTFETPKDVTNSCVPPWPTHSVLHASLASWTLE